MLESEVEQGATVAESIACCGAIWSGAEDYRDDVSVGSCSGRDEVSIRSIRRPGLHAVCTRVELRQGVSQQPIGCGE